jgi:hypothetical protein
MTQRGQEAVCEVVNRAVPMAVFGEALTASSPEGKIPAMEPSHWPPVGLLASGGDAHSRQQP